MALWAPDGHWYPGLVRDITKGIALFIALIRTLDRALHIYSWFYLLDSVTVEYYDGFN